MKIEEKIAEIVSKLTLEEKVGLCHGKGLFQTGSVPNLVQPLIMSDGPMGVRREFKVDSWDEIGTTADFVSYLPSNMAVAATWSKEMAETFGKTLGAEARGRGKDVILAPGINIVRSPLGGRNFEYMSEDPYLISKLVVPLINGIQENDVAACVKHYACNNHEHNRLNISVELSETALREIYLPGFKAAITEARSHTIMSAYNKLRGSWCSHNSYLLKDILRNEWKFDGVVISDWGAVHNTEDAVNGGLDIEMRVETNFDDFFLADPYIEKLKSGTLDMKTLDFKVSNILRVMFRLNKFSPNRQKGSFNNIETYKSTLDIARESIVLLKNKDNILPLKLKNKILVIGENANRIHSSGGGSAEIKALFEISPLLGLNMVSGGDITVDYLPGYTSENDIEVALDSICNYTDVIIVSGLNHNHDREEFDRTDFSLPELQDRLIDKALDIKDDIVIINISGSPVAMPWIEKSKALIQLFYSGMFSGQAVAEVLLGEVNPSGKMPLTFPKKLEDSPDHYFGDFPGDKSISYNEGLLVGYRFYEKYKIEPLFPFGYGLSYTRFEYSELIIRDLSVSLQIRNSGSFSGKEIIQLYIKRIEIIKERPVKELKRFSKIELEPDVTEEVNFELDLADFSIFNEDEGRWIVPKGEYEILCGSSSDNILLSCGITI